MVAENQCKPEYKKRGSDGVAGQVVKKLLLSRNQEVLQQFIDGRILAGFKSRWTMPLRWTSARPQATCAARKHIRAGNRALFDQLLSVCRREIPSPGTADWCSSTEIDNIDDVAMPDLHGQLGFEEKPLSPLHPAAEASL